MATFDPKTYDHEAFEALFVKTCDKAQAFVAGLTEDEDPDDIAEVEAGIFEAASTAVLGTWFELHRIADALEAIAAEAR